MPNGKIAMVGLGKLGLSIAACFANAGFKVIGVDINEQFINKINKKVAPFYEPGLQKLLEKNVGKNLTASSDFNTIKEARWIFVIVPTPSNKDGSYSNAYVIEAMKSIGKVLKRTDGYKVIVLTSTVFPYTTEKIIKPLLEDVSGKKAGQDFGLCYNPEFIAVGSLIKDFLNQEMVLIGQDDDKAGREIESIYRKVTLIEPHVARMSLLNAEITKIGYNSFMTTKVTFANTIAEICQRTEGADVDQITQALGFDSRIGNKLLKGAIGYGGPCWPRDNKALLCFAKSIGYEPAFLEEVDNANLRIPHSISNVVEELANKKDIIVLLGLSYKPNTPLTVESQSIMLARILAREGFQLLLHDPMAGDVSKEDLAGYAKVRYVKSLKQCLKEGKFFILATPWEEYNKLLPKDFSKKGGGKITILDCWRSMDKSFRISNKKIRYIPWGVSNDAR
ncbi:MAG TPA: nucleotide sugar dehydrogenase [Candidatus Acidoferrum sp.]|nr:nucleotide sugar dehydrogenase [Candidatus Acidoferrum sp.]